MNCHSYENSLLNRGRVPSNAVRGGVQFALAEIDYRESRHFHPSWCPD